MTVSTRRSHGGEIDRGKRINFSFDGKSLSGFEGDTLASALLANGVKTFGRSFKYHRPRGLLSAGVEEPNALVGVGLGGRFEPNTRATDVFIYEGLTAVSQNRWPSLAFDLGAMNQWIAPFIPAGFYYKTFFGGPRLWLLYERFIRRAAGLGAAPSAPDPDEFEHRAAFCDVLVVGGGPAGLAAAKAAADAGAKVILVEQDDRFGGSLLRDPAIIDGLEASAWVNDAISAVGRTGLALRRTTAYGYWDQNLATLAERLVEPGQTPKIGQPVQRRWRVQAGRVILAQGAFERPLLFGSNDAPGVMLASAVRSYIERFGVIPGRRFVVLTCTDDAYLTALSILDAGGDIEAVLDLRPWSDSPAVQAVQARAEVLFDVSPLRVRKGSTGVTGVEAFVRGKRRIFPCDLVAMSGGFTPTAHLHMQAGGDLGWKEDLGAFAPRAARQNQMSVGAGSGVEGLVGALEGGWRAGLEAGRSKGFDIPDAPAPLGVSLRPEAGLSGTAPDPPAAMPSKTAFVDFQNDVTAADLDLAWREGYRSVEHLKRYTTLGMATDQGKTSNILGLTRLAHAQGRSPQDVGVTTFRAPFTPVTLGLLAGDAVGEHAAPLRRVPLHDAHLRRGAVWQPSGYWTRPRTFPRGAETCSQAAVREARSVRKRLGLTDVSTLAKFEVSGPDAAILLEFICATSVRKLSVGRGRYTFMLREDGFVGDDGTVWRLEEDRYLLTSSTGGADRMATAIDYARRVLAPDLRTAVANVQEHWAAAALAGPLAKDAMVRLCGRPPAHMSAFSTRIAGVDVRVLAASYSGERAFEVYMPSFEAAPVWEALSAAVDEGGGAVYGLDALELLRIEKGHVEVGAEIDGCRTPADLGLQAMLNPRGGYIGWQGLSRPHLQAPGRQALVGLEADEPIPEGAMLVSDPGGAVIGHVTSSGLRLGDQGGAVALGLAAGGIELAGRVLRATAPVRGLETAVRVTSPHFYDPKGERYRD